jgi:hypothetical protein
MFDHFEGLHLPAFPARRRYSILASWKQLASGCSTVAVNCLYLKSRAFLTICVSPANHGKKRADERTRTVDLLQLRVIGQALQRFARGCKIRISRPVSFPRLAVCCTVLRSRWYQSGINRGIAPSRSCSLACTHPKYVQHLASTLA